MIEIGPVQMLVVAFDHPEFKGDVLAELRRLRERGDIRLVDLFVARKTEEGQIEALKTSDLTPEEAAQFGAIVGGLIGYGAGGEEGMKAGAEAGALAGAMLIADEFEYGVDVEGLQDIAEDIPPGGAVAFALLEHRWAIGLKRAIRDAGGILVAQDFLSPETLIPVGAALRQAVEEERAGA
jgi:uncharacterized membrane protein